MNFEGVEGRALAGVPPLSDRAHPAYSLLWEGTKPNHPFVIIEEMILPNEQLRNGPPESSLSFPSLRELEGPGAEASRGPASLHALKAAGEISGRWRGVRRLARDSPGPSAEFS